MRKSQWKLRCYAERQAPDLWVALCLDFDLAAQGETFEDARARLDAMINDYVEDALTGEDREYADAFLNRRAPWKDWARYYWVSLLRAISPRPAHASRTFREALQLALAR